MFKFRCKIVTFNKNQIFFDFFFKVPNYPLKFINLSRTTKLKITRNIIFFEL